MTIIYYHATFLRHNSYLRQRLKLPTTGIHKQDSICTVNMNIIIRLLFCFTTFIYYGKSNFRFSFINSYQSSWFGCKFSLVRLVGVCTRLQVTWTVIGHLGNKCCTVGKGEASHSCPLQIGCSLCKCIITFQCTFPLVQ